MSSIILDFNPIAYWYHTNLTDSTKLVFFAKSDITLSMKSCRLPEISANFKAFIADGYANPMQTDHGALVGYINFDDNKIDEIHDFLESGSTCQATFHVNPLQCSYRMRWLKHKANVKDIYKINGCQDVVESKLKMFDKIPLDNFLCMKNSTEICDVHCTCMRPS